MHSVATIKPNISRLLNPIEEDTDVQNARTKVFVEFTLDSVRYKRILELNVNNCNKQPPEMTIHEKAGMEGSDNPKDDWESARRRMRAAVEAKDAPGQARCLAESESVFTSNSCS